MATYYLDYELGNDSNDGSTWANAWKTITSGATAARIAPGDTIRIAKSPAPTSLGCTALWTTLSKTVTLATAQNATIDLCDSSWTAAVGSDVSCSTANPPCKEGSFCAYFSFDSSTQASILQAYKATGTLDLSSYQKISFWIKNDGVWGANTIKLCLCSDTAGATVVDSFLIPAIPNTSQWVPLTLAKVGGGNLGSSIQSIALYSDTTTPPVTSVVRLDDIIACTTNGLNLQSLISKNSAEQGGTEAWHGIQSINGTTVKLDNHNPNGATAGKGYYGTTETVTTYKRETIKTELASSSSTVVQEVQDSGTSGNNIQFQGGYDTGTTLQTGETFFDGLNGYGTGIYILSQSYVTTGRLSTCRYFNGTMINSCVNLTVGVPFTSNNSYGFVQTNNCIGVNSTIGCINNNGQLGATLQASNSGAHENTTTIASANNNLVYGISTTSAYTRNTINITDCQNNQYGLYLSESIGNTITLYSASYNSIYGVWLLNSIENIITFTGGVNNNSQYGIYLGTASAGNILKNVSTTGNASGGISNSIGKNYLINWQANETTETYFSDAFCDGRLFSHNHDNTANNHWIFTPSGTINAQTTTRHTASGLAWTLTCPNTSRTSTVPLDFKVAKIACAANALVTVKIWMIKGHATNIAGKLVCRGGQIAGVPSDVTATKVDDTNWEELTITFTPTEAGVVEIEAWAYYVSGASSVTVDDMTITQA